MGQVNEAFSSVRVGASIKVTNSRLQVGITGTFVGSINLEAKYDGTNWDVLKTYTGPTQEVFEEAGSVVEFRLNMTAFTSGSAKTRLSVRDA